MASSEVNVGYDFEVKRKCHITYPSTVSATYVIYCSQLKMKLYVCDISESG